MMALGVLPTELLCLVISELDSTDIKSLRQTCRLLLPPCTHALFSRICISRIWSDRTDFLSIAATPHLAQCVRTLVWYEIPGGIPNIPLIQEDLGYSNFLGRLPWTPPERDVSEELPGASIRNHFASLRRVTPEESALYQAIHTQAKDLFWLPNEDDVVPNPETDFASFDHFPDLNQDGYDLTQKSAIADFLPDFVDALQRLPNLSCLVCEPMHSHRELQPAGSGRYPCSAHLFCTLPDRIWTPCNIGCNTLGTAAKILAKKTSPAIKPVITDLKLRYTLQLTDSEGPFIPQSLFGPDIARFELALQCNISSVPWIELAGLRLSELLPKAPNLTHLRLDLRQEEGNAFTGRGKSLLTFLPHMPRLISLELVGVPLTREVLGDFVAKHVTTIRRLHIEMFPSDESELPRLEDLMESAPRLQLLRFTVRFEEDDFTPEDSVLPADLMEVDEQGAGEDETSPEPIPKGPTHVSSPLGTQMYDLSLEMGGVDHEDPVEVAAWMTAGDPLFPGEEDHRSVYAREQISHLKHHHPGNDGEKLSQWFYARDSGGEIYYRKAHPETEEGWATEVWHFRHRNGEEAYGADPLDFWSDWEGSEAGDVEEPTPFGHVFERVKTDWNPCEGWDAEMEKGRALVESGSPEYAMMHKYEYKVLGVDETVPEPSWVGRRGLLWEPADKCSELADSSTSPSAVQRV